MKYIKRTVSPDTKNKNYLHHSAGGFNYCIEIKNGSCLPNCVGYCWGRWRELLGKYHNLSKNNAENWYSNTADGYKRGSTPKLGAVICWRKGKVWNSSDGCGHVAIVEDIAADGTITTSNSAYGGSRFYLEKLKAPYKMNKYTFQGFIYPPIEFTAQEEVPKYQKGTYRVTAASVLNVREGPGTSYKRKTYKQLTKDARSQVYQLVRYKANGYVRGVEFTVLEVNGVWGRTPSGWVSLDYCTKI